MNRKIYLLIFSITWAFGLSAQQNKLYYAEVGGGLSFISEADRTGFANTRIPYVGYAEFGRQQSIWQLGFQANYGNTFNFYKFDYQNDYLAPYVKLSIGPLLDFIPWGVDPYILGGPALYNFTFSDNRPLDDLENPNAKADIQKSNGTGAIAGAGIKIGQQKLIFGIQYIYQLGNSTFQVAGIDPISIPNGSHQVQVTVGIRFNQTQQKNPFKCFRFYKKRSLRF